MILAEIGYDHARHEAMIAGLPTSATCLAHVVERLSDGWCALYGVEPHEINDGCCFEFAVDARDLLKLRCAKNSTVVWLDDHGQVFRDGDPEVGSGSHAALFVEGRYHDSGSPTGVADPRDLPFFRRSAVLHIATVRSATPA